MSNLAVAFVDLILQLRMQVALLIGWETQSLFATNLSEVSAILESMICFHYLVKGFTATQKHLMTCFEFPNSHSVIPQS